MMFEKTLGCVLKLFKTKEATEMNRKSLSESKQKPVFFIFIFLSILI